MGQPRGVGISIELIPAQVIAHTDSPGGQELIAITRGEIELLLPIAVVHGQVGGVAVEIMGAVISILGQHLSGEAVAKVFLQSVLEEDVGVVLSLTTPPHIVHDRPRDAASRVVAVGFRGPEALAEQPMEGQFYSLRAHIAILPCGRRVIGHTPVRSQPAIAKSVLATGGEPSCRQRET